MCLVSLQNILSSGVTLAPLGPDTGVFHAGPNLSALGYDKLTAVYDISAHAVYMPNGTRFEAHSGMGNLMDDPEHVKVAAVQRLLDTAGFDARATCWPVFGGIWPQACTGPEGDEATAWLQELTNNLQRGDSNDEEKQIIAAVKERLGSRA